MELKERGGIRDRAYNIASIDGTMQGTHQLRENISLRPRPNPSPSKNAGTVAYKL